MKLQLAYNILIATVLSSSSINGDDDVQHTRKLSSLKDDVGSGCANHVDFRARFLTTAGEECNACSLCSENNINQIFVPKAKDVCITCSEGPCDVLELITEFSEGWPIKFVTLTASDMDSKYDPQEAKFLGSNDGKAWDLITSIKVEFKKRTDALKIFVENDTSYTHYAMQLKGLGNMTYVGKYGIVESYAQGCTAQLHEKITGSSINLPTDAQGFTTKEELKVAVNLWQTDEDSALSEYGEIEKWDVSRITDMSYLFRSDNSDYYMDSKNKCLTFNRDLSEWDVSAVTDMAHMFNSCKAFNADLSQWNVAEVTSMMDMFSSAHAFNSNISDWNISNVKNMDWVFYDTPAFDQVLCWDVSKVSNKVNMFYSSKGSVSPDYPDC